MPLVVEVARHQSMALQLAEIWTQRALHNPMLLQKLDIDGRCLGGYIVQRQPAKNHSSDLHMVELLVRKGTRVCEVRLLVKFPNRIAGFDLFNDKANAQVYVVDQGQQHIALQ